MTHALTPWAIAATLFDAAATGMWLRLGIAREGNPLLAALIERIGIAPAMLLRAIVGVALILALDLTLTTLGDRSALKRWAMPTIMLVLAAVAVWHIVGALCA